MFQPEKFSDYVSMIALVFSCASLYLSWRNYVRDRSHLKVSLDFENLPKQGSRFEVTVTNDGRRTTTLVRVDALFWFRQRENFFEQETALTEGMHKKLSAPLARFSSISNPLAIRAFEAVDSVGHKYRAGTLRLLYKIITTKI
ncbi:MAG TPA: hypothetical protein VN653_04450 [Anaerolineales bacterium]|nr:hypothetical protein [Anaerolineales bacterium]